MIKYYHEKQKAIRFTLNIKGDVQEYALSLLHIINNAREYPNTIYKVENTPSNRVYVTCNPSRKESVRDYLKNFGEMEYEDEINWFVVKLDTDYYGYKELFDSDCDQDFTLSAVLMQELKARRHNSARKENEND